MLNKPTLLDLIRHFIVYETTKREDTRIKLTVVETIKKVAAYHQYYAVNKAVNSTLTATAANGDRKGGVVWHTQGSGKSLSMVFYTGKLVLTLDNPTVVVITDRNRYIKNTESGLRMDLKNPVSFDRPYTGVWADLYGMKERVSEKVIGELVNQ